MTRFFVTGTDTGVGKTEVSTALLSLLVEAGARPFAWKPCESGGTGDGDALWRAGGAWQPRGSVCCYQLGAPLAPALAARKEGRRLDWKRLLSAFEGLGPGPGVVEGAGGLFVPLAGGRDVIDLIEACALPVVLVARAGLGTINHTTLSLNALAGRGLEVAAVVLCRASPARDPSIPFNRTELERRFPRTRFVGPVPFIAAASRRRSALKRALTSFL